jgi:hypothetical protein
MDATILKGHSRASHEILHGARHEHFVRACVAWDSRADVHSNAADLGTDHLALARMHARPHFQPEQADAASDGGVTSNGPCGPVEREDRRQDAIRLDHMALRSKQAGVRLTGYGPLGVTRRHRLAIHNSALPSHGALEGISKFLILPVQVLAQLSLPCS